MHTHRLCENRVDFVRRWTLEKILQCGLANPAKGCARSTMKTALFGGQCDEDEKKEDSRRL